LHADQTSVQVWMSKNGAKVTLLAGRGDRADFADPKERHRRRCAGGELLR
jgi:hypothetical protein